MYRYIHELSEQILLSSSSSGHKVRPINDSFGLMIVSML